MSYLWNTDIMWINTVAGSKAKCGKVFEILFNMTLKFISVQAQPVDIQVGYALSKHVQRIVVDPELICDNKFRRLLFTTLVNVVMN